jgi:hypothetical protein
MADLSVPRWVGLPSGMLLNWRLSSVRGDRERKKNTKRAVHEKRKNKYFLGGRRPSPK